MAKQITLEHNDISHAWVFTHGSLDSSEWNIEKLCQVFRSVTLFEFVLDNSVLFVEVKVSPRVPISILWCHDHHDFIVTLFALLGRSGEVHPSRIVLENLFSNSVTGGVIAKERTVLGPIPGHTLSGSPRAHVVEGVGVAVVCYLKDCPRFVDVGVF